MILCSNLFRPSTDFCYSLPYFKISTYNTKLEYETINYRYDFSYSIDIKYLKCSFLFDNKYYFSMKIKIIKFISNAILYRISGYNGMYS